MNKIIFCFPYKGVGGVSLLFIRLAIYLFEQGYQVSVIDYKDGYMSKNLPGMIEFLEYSDEIKLNIPAGCFLVLQTMTPWSIYPMLKIDNQVKLYFITTIPINAYPFLPIFRSKMAEPKFFSWLIWHSILYQEYKKMQDFLILIEDCSAVAYLDYDIVNNIKKNLRIDIKLPVIMPLFSDKKLSNEYINGCVSEKNKNRLVFAWVGRLADFKIHILNKLIQDASNIAAILDQFIEFIIVGSGEKSGQLDLYNYDNITIKCIEEILPDDLNGFLLGVDILFAMGTSALEGAKLGVPTVRLDYSFKPIKYNYLYKWLFEIDDFSLAQQINTNFYKNEGHTLKDIVISLKSTSSLLSQKTFDHYQKNHSIKVAADCLIEGLNNTKLTFHELEKSLLLHSKLYSLWKRIRG